MELKCAECGHTKIVFKCQVLDGPSQRYRMPNGVYICRECWNIKRTGTTWNNKKTEIVTMTCNKCGVKKDYRDCDAKRLKHEVYFCKKCYGIHKSENSSRVVKICKECGKTRFYKPSTAIRLGEYCISCKNKGERNSSWGGGKIIINCADCGKPQSVRKNEAEKYSNRKLPYRCKPCSFNHREGELNPCWQGGKSYETYPANWTPALRRNIRERDGFVCAICSASQTNRRMPVHHIDYDKNNCESTNLITLCATCHTKTNYKREYWKTVLQEKMRGKQNVSDS